MRLRRVRHQEPEVTQATTAWDGLPMVDAPPVVIRAVRAGELSSRTTATAA
jgi:hypothetical protein